MSDDNSFEFETDRRGMSQLPPVLLAIVAIIAIVFVNATALAPVVSARTPAPTPKAATFKPMPALLQDTDARIERGAARAREADPSAAAAATGTLI
jgi:hypothetical protein